MTTKFGATVLAHSDPPASPEPCVFLGGPAALSHVVTGCTQRYGACWKAASRPLNATRWAAGAALYLRSPRPLPTAGGLRARGLKAKGTHAHYSSRHNSSASPPPTEPAGQPSSPNPEAKTSFSSPIVHFTTSLHSPSIAQPALFAANSRPRPYPRSPDPKHPEGREFSGMSTPSTAVATLPQYPQHRQFQPPFTSHYKLEHYSSPTLAATAASTKDLPPPHSPASRYLPYYQSAASAASPTDGVAHAQSSVPPRPPPHVYLESSSSNAATHHHHPGDSISSSMTSATMTAVDHHGLDQSASKKRRRDSHGPDWNHFYRNGLPDEVIVIDDDSPEPEANTSRRITNGTSSQMLPHDGSRGQPAKKRRRDDEQRPGYHIQYLHSHAGTPQYNTTPLGSTLSSDHASLTTTAPTSLSSTSLHDDVPAPLKRKRTTRQQAADEAKRRDVDGLGDPVMTYMPPPYPPKKAGEVTVRVVTDVSCHLLLLSSSSSSFPPPPLGPSPLSHDRFC